MIKFNVYDHQTILSTLVDLSNRNVPVSILSKREVYVGYIRKVSADRITFRTQEGDAEFHLSEIDRVNVAGGVRRR